eukprot:scaffold89075_cov58-Phaeocystis_antarctica.AAC.6
MVRPCAACTVMPHARRSGSCVRDATMLRRLARSLPPTAQAQAASGSGGVITRQRRAPFRLEQHASCLSLAPRARVPTELHKRQQLHLRLLPTHRRTVAAAAAAAAAASTTTAAWGTEADHAAQAAVDQAYLANAPSKCSESVAIVGIAMVTHRAGPHRSRPIEVPEQEHHSSLLEVQQRRRAQVAKVTLVARVARLSTLRRGE